jgi:hypothetical protein
MSEAAKSWQPAYLVPPDLQDHNWDIRQILKPLSLALNRERDHREAGRPFDSHEIVCAMEDCVRALVAKAAQMREMMQ